jgi:hypothetical protein
MSYSLRDGKVVWINTQAGYGAEQWAVLVRYDEPAMVPYYSVMGKVP